MKVRTKLFSLATAFVMTVSTLAGGMHSMLLKTEAVQGSYVSVKGVVENKEHELGTKTTIGLYLDNSDIPVKETIVYGNTKYAFTITETGRYTVKATAPGYLPFI